MARARMISASLGSSRRFRRLGLSAGKLGEFAQCLFPLIVAHSDSYGLYKSDAESIKLEIFPSSPRSEADFETAIQAMASSEVGLIRLYEAAGERYLEVLKFDEHQPGLHPRGSEKRGRPRCPLPTDAVIPEAATAAVAAAVEEEEETKSESETASGKQASRGTRSAQPRDCDEEYLAGLQAEPAYQRIDVLHVFNKMEVWCKQSGKQPTRRRLINWLNREDQPLNGQSNARQSASEKNFRDRVESEQYLARR